MSTSPPRLLALGNTKGAEVKTSATIRFAELAQSLNAGTYGPIVVDLADTSSDATRIPITKAGESDA